MRTPAFIGAFFVALISLAGGLTPQDGLALAPAVAHADDWTTYAHPNDLKDVTVVGGALWFATTGGALRYDLATGTFQQYPRRLAGGPVSQDLTSVCYDAVNGLVYFGSADAGVSQYAVADDLWRRFDEIPNNEIRSVTSAGGELFVATASGFALRRSASRTDLCNDIDRGCCGPASGACASPSFDVRDFAMVDTALWAVTAEGRPSCAAPPGCPTSPRPRAMPAPSRVSTAWPGRPLRARQACTSGTSPPRPGSFTATGCRRNRASATPCGS